MNKRFLVAMVLSAISTASPTSVGAGDCSIIERLKSSAGKRFTDIQGAADEFGDYAATYVMPGAKCDIVKRSYVEYSCRWYSNDKESTRADFETFVSSTRPCLANLISEGRNETYDGGESVVFRQGVESIDISYDRRGRRWIIQFSYRVRQ